MIAGSLLLLSIGAAAAQTPSADAMTAARELVTTLKLSDQYKALLPAILLGIKPVLTQDRPEIERDYNAMLPTIEDAYTPYYNAMLDGIATVYASSFYGHRAARHERVLRSAGRPENAGKVAGDHASRRRRSARITAARRPRS